MSVVILGLQTEMLQEKKDCFELTFDWKVFCKKTLGSSDDASVYNGCQLTYTKKKQKTMQIVFFQCQSFFLI